jgi:hypothetical protein
MSDADIKRFSEYFADQIRYISQLNDSLYTRILWVTLLDSLSRAGAPQLGNKNKERILYFLEKIADWTYSNQVSLPQLRAQLEVQNLTEGKLSKIVSEKLASWIEGDIYTPSDDLPYCQLKLIACCESEKARVKQCRYMNLFYSYRNHLVHGFRPPGHGFNHFSRSKQPFYHSTSNGELTEWELVFPDYLFWQLCQEGLAKLTKLLHEQKRSPYTAYDLGFIW